MAENSFLIFVRRSLKWLLLCGLLIILFYLFRCYFFDGGQSFFKMDRETVQDMFTGLPSPDAQCYAKVFSTSLGKDPSSQLMVTCKSISSSVIAIGGGLRAFHGATERVKVEWKSNELLLVTYPEALKAHSVMPDTQFKAFNKVIIIEYKEIPE